MLTLQLIDKSILFNNLGAMLVNYLFLDAIIFLSRSLKYVFQEALKLFFKKPLNIFFLQKPLNYVF